MWIERFCVTAAVRVWRPGLLLAVLAVAGCNPPPAQMSQASPPKTALPFDAAVEQLTVSLFARAKTDTSDSAGRVLVIDPLIDRASGNEAVATRSMERRMAEVVRGRFRGIAPKAFTPASLSEQPLVLVGSITPVAGPGVIPPTTAPTQTYRIWAALADLRTNKIVSHETAWVRGEEVDMTPAPFYRDSPSWLPDRSQVAYIKTCAGNPGDAVSADYLNGLVVSAIVAEGVRAYEAGAYGDARTAYAKARDYPAGQQLRVLNGLYLANAALGERVAAEQAFGDVVDYGIAQGKLAVKFVFRPNSSQFWPDREISGPYPMWLRQIAVHADEREACLRLVGHTSATGSADRNMALSLLRARVVQRELVRRDSGLVRRTEAVGRGSSEVLVGSGRDDATDLLDRRVEFETAGCGSLVHG